MLHYMKNSEYFKDSYLYNSRRILKLSLKSNHVGKDLNDGKELTYKIAIYFGIELKVTCLT